MIDLTHPEIELAVQSVRTACLLVRKIQSQLVSPALTKSDRSPVTIADYASQALIASQIQQTLPNDVLVAEEDAGELRSGKYANLLEQITTYVKEFLPHASAPAVCDWIDMGAQAPVNQFWTLDPIDGTKGFLRGDQYAIALARIRDGLVDIGVLGCPNLVQGRRPQVGGPGSLVVAVRGQGAWSCPIDAPGSLKRLYVSQQADLQMARLLRSFESGHTNADKISDFVHKTGSRLEPIRMDSQAKYALLASGEAELLFRMLSEGQPDYREKIWDQAAGSIILEEAGGKVSDLEGRTLDFNQGRTLSQNRGILASNGQLHAAALEALRSVGS